MVVEHLDQAAGTNTNTTTTPSDFMTRHRTGLSIGMLDLEEAAFLVPAWPPQ